MTVRCPVLKAPNTLAEFFNTEANQVDQQAKREGKVSRFPSI